MKIVKAYTTHELEPFIKPFGFKGRSLSGGWQIYTLLVGEGEIGLGLGMQSVLWSDSSVFLRYGEEKSNEMMFRVTEYALSLITGKSFSSPKEMTESLIAPCIEYAERITDMKVTETFVLNALVSVDLAVWQLYSNLNGITSFDKIYKGQRKQDLLASIPLITYGTSVDEVKKLAEGGTPLFKIKLGADPDGDGDPEKMLDWDKKRIIELHSVLKDIKTPYTDCSHPVYYFDANGRYDTKERLSLLVDFMVECGAAERTVLFEEPFSPENKINISEFPICFAADESCHSVADVAERISLGYRAITLKPIAKTLSVSIDMAECAHRAGIACFCADLTVSPAMVEWNKNFAARLNSIPGMRIGVLETNGEQNYKNYEKMKALVPYPDRYESGVFNLLKGFYVHAGGIFEANSYYLDYIKTEFEIEEDF